MAKVLVTGSSGQLGQCLADTCSNQLVVTFFDRARFNLCDREQMREILQAEKPEFVLNGAAYTNVDGAQTDAALADKVNHAGVVELARLCSEFETCLIHISTDFVFDGLATEPYATDHPTAPLGVYGKTKYAGEQALLELMPETAMVIRTSWLYSEYGGNFVKTVLRLFESMDSFSVVCDQFGSPTYARGLAKLIWHILESGHFTPGVFHWSDAGVTSWFEFAREIGEQGRQLGLLTEKAEILEILAKDYSSAAPRPDYSALNCEKILGTYPMIRQVGWQTNLTKMLSKLSREA